MTDNLAICFWPDGSRLVRGNDSATLYFEHPGLPRQVLSLSPRLQNLRIVDWLTTAPLSKTPIQRWKLLDIGGGDVLLGWSPDANAYLFYSEGELKRYQPSVIFCVPASLFVPGELKRMKCQVGTHDNCLLIRADFSLVNADSVDYCVDVLQGGTLTFSDEDRCQLGNNIDDLMAYLINRYPFITDHLFAVDVSRTIE